MNGGVTGLTSGAAYLARLVVTTAAGTTASDAVRFTATPAPPPPCPAGEARNAAGLSAIVKVRPGALSLTVTPGRDLLQPFRFTLAGRLTLLRVVPAQACRGRVRVLVVRGAPDAGEPLGGAGAAARPLHLLHHGRVPDPGAARHGEVPHRAALFLGNARLLTRAAPARIARVR